MKVIPRLDVSCLYKQTRQASAILPVQTVTYEDRTAQSRKFDFDNDDDDKKKKPSAFYGSEPPYAARVKTKENCMVGSFADLTLNQKGVAEVED